MPAYFYCPWQPRHGDVIINSASKSTTQLTKLFGEPDQAEEVAFHSSCPFIKLVLNPCRRQALENRVEQVEDVIQRKLVEEKANEQAAGKKGVSRRHETAASTWYQQIIDRDRYLCVLCSLPRGALALQCLRCKPRLLWWCLIDLLCSHAELENQTIESSVKQRVVSTYMGNGQRCVVRTVPGLQEEERALRIAAEEEQIQAQEAALKVAAAKAAAELERQEIVEEAKVVEQKQQVAEAANSLMELLGITQADLGL